MAKAKKKTKEKPIHIPDADAFLKIALNTPIKKKKKS